MRPTSRKPSVAGRVAAAVLLSLGLHGLIVLGVWLAPVSLPTSTAAVDPTQVPAGLPGPRAGMMRRRRLRGLRPRLAVEAS